MASKTYGKSGKPTEMEEREGTDEEVSAIAGAVGLTNAPAPPLVQYAGDREDDQPDREGPPPQVIAAQQAAESLTSTSINERLLKALESLESRAAEGGSNGTSELMAMAMLQLADAMKGIKEGQLQAAQIIANMQRTTMAPENKFHHNISVFNLRGDKDFPRPALRCDYFLPWPIKPSAAEELTREEIELLNLIEAGEHTITRTDRTKVKVLVRIDRKYDSEEPSRVVFQHDTAFNNDYHQLMPHDWIRQMLYSNPKTKAKALQVLTMDEEEALILARQFNDGRQAQAGEAVVSVGA